LYFDLKMAVDSTKAAKIALWTIVAFCIVGALVYMVVVSALTFDPDNVKHVGGLAPRDGSIGIEQGPGITIFKDTATSTMTINANGVQRVVGGPGIAVSGTAEEPLIENTGILQVSAGPGIVVSGINSNKVVANTGLLDAIGGDGIYVDGSANPQEPVIRNTGVHNLTNGTGMEVSQLNPAPIVTHALSRQMRDLALGDAQSPVVKYTIDPPPLAANIWHRPMGGANFTIATGDGGQGNVGNTAWIVPAHGFYMVSVTCRASLNAPAMQNRVGISVAITFDATGDDPSTGKEVLGGYQRADVSYNDGTSGTLAPTAAPVTVSPTTKSPTASPTTAPTQGPTTKSPTVGSPTTDAPTIAPTQGPTTAPSQGPTFSPTSSPTDSPTVGPTSAAPTAAPTTPAPPALVHHLSFTGSFQVCNGTAIGMGSSLFFHALLDSTGGSADVQLLTLSCGLQMAKIV
jgi:hypothetical protein